MRLEFACAAEYVLYFVDIEFFHVFASRSEVFARVKLCGFCSEHFTNCCCHCKTAVRVDVDFANCRCSGFAEFFFGDTDCVFESTSVFVDGLDFVLRN